MKGKPINFVTGTKRSQLTKSIRQSAKTNNNRIHVIPTKGMWGIKLEGRDKLIRIYPTKAVAIRHAISRASAGEGSRMIIHGKDGRVSSSKSYEKPKRYNS